MTRIQLGIVSGLVIHAAASAWASDAQTSATAGSSRFGPGVAASTARYSGDLGFARARSESGDQLSRSRGVAVGLDEDGLTLSVSNAVALRGGPAIATNFNIAIGTDGDVSHSRGVALAQGPLQQQASAGGVASSGQHVGGVRISAPLASSVASGKSDPLGRVQVHTQAHSGGPRIVRRPGLRSR